MITGQRTARATARRSEGTCALGSSGGSVLKDGVGLGHEEMRLYGPQKDPQKFEQGRGPFLDFRLESTGWPVLMGRAGGRVEPGAGTQRSMAQAWFCSQPAGISQSVHGVLWWQGLGGQRAQDGSWATDSCWPGSVHMRLCHWEQASSFASVPQLGV